MPIITQDLGHLKTLVKCKSMPERDTFTGANPRLDSTVFAFQYLGVDDDDDDILDTLDSGQQLFSKSE